MTTRLRPVLWRRFLWTRRGLLLEHRQHPRLALHELNLLHRYETRESLAIEVTGAHVYPNHSRGNHAHVYARGDMKEFVEDVIATRDNNSGAMLEEGCDAVEYGGLNLIRDQQE